MFIQKESFSSEETFNIGMELGLLAKSNDIYCLSGDLGVGKTVFVKGFANGIEVKDYVTSPTFTLINEYSGRLRLYHFDVYRIENASGMDDLGYMDYFNNDGVCVIEWAELVKEIIPKSAYWISIKKDYNKSEDYRIITIEGSL